MKQFKIFKHPSGAIEAVKQGWSWPAFFFGFVWAMMKKMWKLSIGVVLAILVIGFITGIAASEEMGEAILNGIGMTANLMFGVHGNSWREESLIARGFAVKKMVSAASAGAAVALYLENDTSASPS
ncbi:MAG: DUF2628 domain-containing protein [Candidatus Manganitrophus sp. SA1]|nr:DUF2628 domain-containing protein [Candidatus Manganitrophus morganii]